MGAAKAGVSVVTFEEKDEADSLNEALRESGARGLLFSPSTAVNEAGDSRQSFVQRLMPELNKLYPGDELNLSGYPNLKQIIQTDHNNIRGVIKFKDSLVYANTALSGFSLPQNSSASQLYECYRGGRRVSSFTNGEIADRSINLWNENWSQTAGDVVDGKMFNYEFKSGQTAKPVFMSVDLETPLGFCTFLANSANHRKVFIPATYNMSKVLKSISAQQSVDLVCDSSFYQIELPGPMTSEYKQSCSSVKNIIVASKSSNVSSRIFGGSVKVVDPLTL
jgi:hypothetical protein